jgi:aspartyl-tRNA(Asn)/glutamyl-tRNA(Gln) amidotransferase subunit A
VNDVSILLEVNAGADEFDSTVSSTQVEEYSTSIIEKNKKFRFAYFKETLEHPSLDIEIAGEIKKLIAKIENDGHEVAALDFEYLDYIVPAYYILTTAEASSNLSRYDGVRYGHRSSKLSNDLTEFYKHNRSEGFGKEVKRRIMLGTFVLSTGYYEAYFTKAQKVRRKLVEKTDLAFRDFDFILMPTSPSVAFKIGEKKDDPIAMYLADIYTVFANLTGIPGISLPLFKHSNGMPFGVQLMAKQFKELSLLQASEQLMQLKK